MYDGQRGIAVVDGGGTATLLSRNSANITGTFPEISSTLADGGRRMILDGEIVAIDENGVPSFARLQRRWPQNRRPSSTLLQEAPVRFYVFDVLQLDGQDLTKQPYAQRRARLTELAADTACRTLQFPANWTRHRSRHRARSLR
jgi:bifunctional non-homologous end joining protein LigD